MQIDKVNTETKPKDCGSIVSIDRKKITLLFVAIRDKTPIDAITVVKFSWVAYKIQQQL